MHNLEVTAKMRVSRFSKLLSLVRRMSAGENSEKTSSADSGSSQNCRTVNRSVLLVGSSLECHTPVQYGSSARMSFCSERRKMPCLKTSFESEAPIRNHFIARLPEVGCRQTNRGRGVEAGSGFTRRSPYEVRSEAMQRWKF